MRKLRNYWIINWIYFQNLLSEPWAKPDSAGPTYVYFEEPYNLAIRIDFMGYFFLLFFLLLLEKCALFSWSSLCLHSQEWASWKGCSDVCWKYQGRNDSKVVTENFPAGNFVNLRKSCRVRWYWAKTKFPDVWDPRRPRAQSNAQFESLVLSMVYAAHQAWHHERKEEQEATGGVLLRLANVIVHELHGNSNAYYNCAKHHFT